jgi:hypothetical protein
MREACNKVLHADEYRFSIERLNEPDSYIQPIIILYGETHDGTKWRTEIDIIRYIEIGMLYTRS